MYYNELEYELRRNSKIIKQRDDIFTDIVRHTRSDQSEKQTTIDVLNRDIERLNNLNEEHLNKVYKYEEKIKKLKYNLSSEQKTKDDIFTDIVRHTRSDQSEKQNIDVLNRDIERLNNLNEEHLNKVYKYEEKIKKLKYNLSSEQKS